MSKTSFQIGVATVDITPPLGVLLAGYGPRKGTASEVGHPLRAEALVCRGDDGRAWALLTSDVIGYPYEMVQRIRREVAAQVPLKPEAILISGTHTHSGPSALSTYNEKLGDADHAYRREFEPKIVKVLVDAFKAARPGSFEVAWTKAPDLAHNRRVIDDSLGTCENVWLDEQGEHSGYFDPTVMVLAVRREDDRRDAMLVNYGCHPVTLGPRSLAISSDYPGYLKDALESERPGLTVMFALAGGGNINPRHCIQVGAEHPKQMGEALAGIVRGAVAKLKPLPGGPVVSSRQPWSFTSCREWPEASPRKKGRRLETEIQALRAGDLAVVSLPGELFSQYAAMLRKTSPVSATVVVSLANDSTGYLPVDEALPQGGHEVVHRSAAEGIEQSLMATAGKAFAGIAK
ncbi:MAG: neutral/alkaline non-lysosomal ceramidase N-terminal domain-containing protein [Planctomycetes bacterium]|nr:neutral/alkaline non-lysosomal ceramidase N-terminal domain-containing protein [Planctomycetota bacterium]